MASFNKIIMMGNLTRDPQLSYLPSSTAVCEIGLATTKTFQKQDGSKGEETCFVSAKIFGKRAEVINKYFHKGDPILIEGRLQYQSWEKDGQKRSKNEIFIENFEFVKSGNSGGQQDSRPAQENDQPPEDLPFG